MRPIKDELFKQHGDEILRQRLSDHRTSPPSFRIFTADELDRATDCFSEARIIGPATSSCTVYKGRLPDSADAAVKRFCHISDSDVELFVSELITLSALPPEKPVARILGACFRQTAVPIVVYEYVPNGTLHHHIHELRGSLSWESRLRIAGAVAEAVACLHSAFSLRPPLFHRGVRTRDVLMDEGMNPKLSDFGGRLVKVDCEILSRILEGRDGYLDPEFMANFGEHQGDVYGFGVMMAELLTGELPASADGRGNQLGARFAEAVGEDRLEEMLEERVREEAGKSRVLEAAADVARRCLMVKGAERPAMDEVAEELLMLMRRHALEEEEKKKELTTPSQRTEFL